MGCNDKIKHTCGQRVNSRCVPYEGYVPTTSELSTEECNTIHDTTIDLYKTTEDMQDSINLKTLGKACLDYEEDELGEIRVREALLVHEREICLLKQLQNAGGTTGLNINNLDMKCLEDVCGNRITSVEVLLQAIIDKLCGEPA